MRLAINRLVASKAFAKSGARQYQAFKRAVPLLLEYAKTMDGVVEEAASARPEATANTKPAPMQSETDAKERAVLEPSLSDLLRGDQFSILRQALLEKGINTLEAFGSSICGYYEPEWAVQYWPTTSDLFDRAACHGFGKRFRCALEAHYTGARICGRISGRSTDGILPRRRAEYPLKFRGLIGQQIRGTGLIP